MTIPFLDFFKKKTAQTVGAAAAPLAPLDKPSSERFSKTVMPNATRQGAPEDTYRPASSGGRGSANQNQRAPISFGASAPAGRSADLPPAVALALEPRVERVISLELPDVVSQMPEGLVRPLEEADTTKHVLFKASEVERGMATGKPSVSVTTIYKQVPEIFLHEVGSDDTTEVILPFEKVLEQFSKMQVRSDQKKEQCVPQVETPFLKVTLEDDALFGTTTDLTHTDDLPPVRVELATAEALAAAEPEAIIREKTFIAPRPTQYPVSTDSNGNGNGSGSRQPPPAIPPARIHSRFHRKGRTGPHLREFQPPADRPFRLVYLHAFRSGCPRRTINPQQRSLG